MSIISLIISIIGLVVSAIGLYCSVELLPWTLLISIPVGASLLVTVIFTYIKYLRSKARKYAAVSIGLEWIRLLFEERDQHRVRVSYFEIKHSMMKNVVRVPFGTEMTKETFAKGEGFAGACWKEYRQSGQRVLIVSDLPIALDNQEELLEMYHSYNAYIDEDKALRFKSDLRSYLIIALVKANLDRDVMGFVCLDSNAPYEFEAPEEASPEEHDSLNSKLTNVFAIVDIISRALYT